MNELLPRPLCIACTVALICMFASQNIANIIVSTQVADHILIVVLRTTCAFTLYPDWGVVCVAHTDTRTLINNSVFGDSVYPVSYGFVLVALLTVPLSYSNLSSNVFFQIVGVSFTILCVLVWVLNFASMGLTTPVPALNFAGSGYQDIIPTVMFNFGFVTTVASWINEKVILPAAAALLLPILLLLHLPELLRHN
jgi:hypothetical protein